MFYDLMYQMSQLGILGKGANVDALSLRKSGVPCFGVK